MALQKQKVFVQFGQGIDTKTDEKLIVPGKMLECENAVFNKNGRTDKRRGSDLLNNRTVDDTKLTGASSCAVFNQELLQYNKQRLYSFSENSNRWVDKGRCVSASVSTNQIIKNTTNQTQCDYASVNGIGVYAWEDSRTGVYATVFDEAEQTATLPDINLSSNATRCKCIAFKGYLYVFYYRTGNLYARRINPQTPTVWETEISLTTDVNTTDPTYDLYSYNDLRIAIAFNMQSASKIKFQFADENLNVLSGSLAAVEITGAATSSLTLIKGALDRFFVLWANTTDGLRCKILNNGGATLIATFTVENYTATEILNITGAKMRDDTGITVLYHVAIASATYNHYVKKVTITNSGGAGTPAVWMRGVGLWSKAFSYYFTTESTDHFYVTLSYSSTLQSSYFIVRDDGYVVGKMQYSTGAGHPTRRLLSTVVHEDTNKFSFAILNKFKLVSTGDDVFSFQGVSKTSIDFDATEQFNSAQLGNNLHIVGGVLSMYDGQSVVEHGFHLFPEAPTLAQSGSAGIPDGTYSYITMYEWTDNYGQIHRSAPSTPVSIIVSGGPKQVDITFPTLRLTEKCSRGSRTEIVCVVYRTEKDSGTVYYRASSATNPNYNDPTADAITISDTTLDASLVTKEILYTTGSVLENISPPACKFITTFKNRVFLAGLENKDELWYSKSHSAGEPVEFTNFFTLTAASEGGGLSALDVLDDKVILFKRDRFFITYGDGPNNTGEGQELAEPQLITSDAGCPYHNSIARYPGGLLFKSLKGIYSLNSSLQLNYIGAPVEDFNANTITSASVKADDNQVRFTTSESPTLVFDYYNQQWSTFDVQEIKDSVIWNTYYVAIDATGDIYKENAEVFKDNGRVINMNLVTGWIAVDSIGGFQRLYKVSVIGEYKSPHKARIAIGYDFAHDFSDNYIFDSEDAFAPTAYGDDSPYGAGTPYGGVNNSLRYVIKPAKQKCQAFRIRIQDLTAAAESGSGEGFNITGLVLEIGVKGQVGKFRSQQIVAKS